MSRLEWSFNIFSKRGIKFLLLEFIIVFAGVYLAFLFQNYTNDQKIESEKEKVLIGLKQDLEFFRLYLPGYASNAENLVQRWREQHSTGSYSDFYTWRFIQPQYKYTSLEYALNTEAEVIDFNLYSSISEVYQELQKLQHAESLMTEIAMSYQNIPSELQNQQEGILLKADNLHRFRLFTDRATDRARIMNRIAELSGSVLPLINDQFSPITLKEIETQLIKDRINLSQESQLDQYIPFIIEYFPNFSEEEVREIFSKFE